MVKLLVSEDGPKLIARPLALLTKAATPWACLCGLYDDKIGARERLIRAVPLFPVYCHLINVPDSFCGVLCVLTEMFCHNKTSMASNIT